MGRRKVQYSTTLNPKIELLVNRLAADLKKYANEIIEEGILAVAKKNRKKSDAYTKYKEDR